MIGGKFAYFHLKEGKAMITSPSPRGSSVHHHQHPTQSHRKNAAELEAQARLVEHMIPNFKNNNDRKFYTEVLRSYRAAARDILRKAWSDDEGQDIAEYAVMLAVILIIVVGTVRLIGSNANTVFSQAASSIQ
jgi:Flp pilus assembly pilin Flp